MPSEDAGDIGLRIRELRELSDIAPEAMAQHVGVTASQYRRYEEGLDDIPASELNAVAGRLGVDLGLLLTGEPARMKGFAVTRKGRGPGVDRRKGYRYQNLAASFQHARFEPFLVDLPAAPADAPIPQNAHSGQEFNYLLEGRMAVGVHGNEVILEPGDSIIFDASQPHGMKALDGEPARFLAMITP